MSGGRTAAQTIAGFAAALTTEDVPEPVQRSAILHLLDGFGCAIAAHRAKAVWFAVDAALKDPEPEQATVIGEGRRVATTAAAMANGALVHALDFDDTHEEALVHATAAVLPAAFAVGEERHASGAQVLAAVIAGYETVIRLGAAVPHGFHRRGLHATSVCGVFAAAVAASKLLGSHADQIANALGIAGSMSAGSLEFLNAGSATKQLHPGLSAMNGIVAARLAFEGAEGPATVFEGEHGLYRTLAGVRVDPAALTRGLGETWETARIAIKPYPACQLSHAAFDALRQVEDLDPDAIERFVIEVPASSLPIVCEPREIKSAPRNAYDAKFSLPWSAAALVIDGRLDLRTYQDVSRPDVKALAARIECVGVAYDGAPARAPAEVEITVRSGRVIRRSVTPGGTLDEAALMTKLRDNCGPLDAEALAAAVLALPASPTLKELASALDLRGAT